MNTRKPPGENRLNSIESARDRLAAAGFMASLISHRARNRLSTLRAALELLDAGLERNLSAEYRSTLLRELDALVDDFNLGVDMVRSDFGPLEALSAKEAVEGAMEAFGAFAERRGIALEFRAAAPEHALVGDRRLVRLVLLNLLRNAAQALEGVPSGKVGVRTEIECGRLAIWVEDNGPGIGGDVHDRLLLEPVSVWGGTGLGLILCRDAMTIMEGAIRCASAKGAPGARFRLEFGIPKVDL
jgi:signal transduction histidine kinase